mgnify:CR=1 FL=1
MRGGCDPIGATLPSTVDTALPRPKVILTAFTFPVRYHIVLWSSQDSVDTQLRALRTVFELLRANTP